MKISLNEIKKYVDIPKEMSTDELVKLIGSRLVEVEGTEDLSKKYKDIFVVKVVEAEKIPDTHLTLCKIDAGREEPIQVVCGAPNVHKGMLAAWIAPGAIVPETFGEENFKLSVRKLRGYESHGMLAAMDELALGEGHEGIIEIEPGFAKPGDKFAEVFGLDDVILDIENKSLTHRPDCFGIIGFAREVSGILNQNFANTILLRTASDKSVATDSSALRCRFALASQGVNTLPGSVYPSKEGVSQNSNSDAAFCDVKIFIQSSEICQKYSCAVIEVEGANEKNKYFTLDDVFLAKAGMRSISKIVDVTNILMLLTGQPLHAFDYDKFLKVGGEKKAKVGVRLAKKGEELQLLDGKTIECDENDILITSNDVPVALAGAMGGANTEIDASTKRVLLESATFSLYHLRKTQMKHGIFSEAITRFTKGRPAGQVLPVLFSACTILSRTASDEFAVVSEGEVTSEKPVRVSVGQINGLLGTEYSAEECVRTLTNVGFEVEQKKEDEDVLLVVTVPDWRTDIHIAEDVIEEIGRLNGFDNIPKSLAVRPFVGAKLDSMFSLKTRIRDVMADELNAHEVLTYSFVSKDLQEKVLEKPEDSYEIVNSLSLELQVFRQSLVPSLLEKTYDNLKAGYKGFALFEMNQVTGRGLGLDEDGVPKMENHLAMVIVGNYYEAKVRLERLVERLGRKMWIVEPKENPGYFEGKRTGDVYVGEALEKARKVGAVGEIKNSVRRKMKLESMVAAVEISLDTLLGTRVGVRKAVRVSRFPMVGRDVTVKVKTNVAYEVVKEAIEGGLTVAYARKMANKKDEVVNLLYGVEPKSIYEKGDGYKNISFHVEFSDMKKTLGEKEIKELMGGIEERVKEIKGEIV